jgi:hypothetical protein
MSSIVDTVMSHSDDKNETSESTKKIVASKLKKETKETVKKVVKKEKK